MSTDADCRSSRVHDAAPNVGPLRLRVENLRHLGWRAHHVERYQNWCGHGQEVIPFPRAEGAMETFHIFVNVFRGLTRHNLRITKQFTSAAWSDAVSDEQFRSKYLAGTVNYFPFVPGARETGFISPFCMSAMNAYRVEYDAERLRAAAYPLAPSRLSATYAFGDYETCVEVSRRHGWNLGEVRRFRLERDALTRVRKCNMAIVSLASYAYLVSSLSEETANTLWASYWSGQGSLQIELPDEDLQPKSHNSGEIWEYLIEGRLVLEDGQAGVS